MISNESRSGGETLAKEIERKWLITAVPEDIDLAECDPQQIAQGYLSNSDEAAIRVRKKGRKYFWTVKKASTDHAAERVELETEITKEQFDIMWPGTAGKRLEKTRYHIPFEDHTIELDVFAGDNKGRMLAEVEFSTTSAADIFEPPEWFGQDVTADKRFGNGSIAEQGFPVSNEG